MFFRFYFLPKMTMNIFRIFGVNLCLKKIFEFSGRVLRCRFDNQRHPTEKFKDFSKAQIDSKNPEKIYGHFIYGKKYTSVNFYRIFEANLLLEKNKSRKKCF